VLTRVVYTELYCQRADGFHWKVAIWNDYRSVVSSTGGHVQKRLVSPNAKEISQLEIIVAKGLAGGDKALTVVSTADRRPELLFDEERQRVGRLLARVRSFPFAFAVTPDKVKLWVG
jgi:hypothetical protein